PPSLQPTANEELRKPAERDNSIPSERGAVGSPSAPKHSPGLVVGEPTDSGAVSGSSQHPSSDTATKVVTGDHQDQSPSSSNVGRNIGIFVALVIGTAGYRYVPDSLKVGE